MISVDKILDESFMPHRYNHIWESEIVWTQTFSDTLLAFSYIIIPFALIFSVRNRSEINFKKIFLLFGVCIAACGITHIISVINIWTHWYGIDAFVKITAALASLLTAVILVKYLPRIMSISSAKEFEKLNVALKEQIEKLKEKDKTREKIPEFEFLADFLPQIIWTATPDGNLDYYNKRWIEYTGMTLEQTQGWGWKPVLHPDDLQNCIDVWTNAYTSGQPYEVEYRFKKASDGEYRWHLGRAFPMMSEQGEVVKWFGSCTDIHDRKVAEEKLKNSLNSSEDLLREVFENTYDALFLTDNYKIIDCNTACIKLFDCESKEEFLGLSSLKLRVEPLTQEAIEEIESTLQQHGSWIGEAEYLTLKGKIFWGSIATNLLKIETRKLTLVRISDISFKKNQEDLLRKSEAEFRAMSEASPLGIFVTDTTGDCTYTNKAYHTISGLSLEQTLGKGWTKAIFEEDKDAVFHNWYTVVNHKENFSHVFRFEKPTKEISWVSVKAAAIEDNGNILGYVGTVDNITSIKLAETKLNETSETLVLATKAGNIGIWDFDLINNELKWDKIMYTLYGTDPKTSPEVYATWESSLHPDDYVRGNEEIQMAIRGEKEFDTEFCIIWPDKSLHYLKASALVQRDALGKAVRMIGTNWDVTEKRKAERDLLIGKQELLVAKEAAEKANVAKSRFLASMSHEIRTPLNGIIGFTHVLKNTNLSDNQSEYVDYINTSGTVLLKLIGDILDLTKIEEGKLTYNNERYHFKETIQSALNPYSVKANERGLTFQLTIDPSLETWVFSDSHRINQVLINLIGNALKFTQEGGVEINCEQVSRSQEEINLKISVTDTGIGVPAENQKIMFDPFTLANHSVVKEFGGTGLGLSIVKEIISGMHGEVGVISPVMDNKGTTIWFILKLRIDKNQEQNGNKKLDSNDLKFDREIAVLLAEDNFVNQKLAEVVLKKLGCKVEFANDGQYAIDKLKIKSYDIILMDIQMPRLDGLKAATIIRNELKLTVPIIAFSANVFEDDIQNSINAGMNDHIGKPYTKKTLYEAIKKQLDATAITQHS